jgi:trigger factor
MQVTQTQSEGLQRELSVTVPAATLSAKVDQKLAEIQTQASVKGFRPGKVPLEHLRKLHGQNVMADVINQIVMEGSQKALNDNNLKPAYQPEINFPEEKEKVDAILAGKADLEFTMKLEIMPEISHPDFAKLTLTKPVAEVDEKEVDEAIVRLSEQAKSFEDKGAKKSVSGDRLTINFVGKLDGEPFEGGAMDDAPLELGSNQFIPGFEDQLIGTKAGDEKTIIVTFPEAYQAPHLAGKEATFDVKVTLVEEPKLPEINDDLAKNLGFDDLGKLKDAVRTQIADGYVKASRNRLKRDLLDKLDEEYSFELPKLLVEQEFEGIWKQITEDMERHSKTFADEKTTEEDARKEYFTVSERRVRLGLALAQLGEEKEIKITDQEVSQAVMQRATQFPGQEKQVFEYFSKNPEALAQLRAPLFEEKVVDFILELAKIEEKSVSKEELFKSDEDEEEHVHDENCGHNH